MIPGNNFSRELPKSAAAAATNVYRGPTRGASSSASIYRSLEVPLAPTSQLELHRTTGDKTHPNLFGPSVTSKGEATWKVSGTPSKIVEKESKPLPIPLIVANSPHTTLLLKSDPVSLVVNQVIDLFERHLVDSVFDNSKFKWKCACYNGATETRFVCHLFSVPDKPNYFVLDFQKRSGDPFHFQSIHRAMHTELLKSGFMVCCATDVNKANSMETVPIRCFKPLALPADFFKDEAQENVEEKDAAKDYDPLCQMCTSQFIDVQREGLCALASQLQNNSSARQYLAPFSQKLFELISRTRDEQVRRLAAAALANLTCDCSDVQFPVQQENIDLLAKLLRDEQEVLETRRQVGKVLANFAKSSSPVSIMVKSAAASFKNAHIIAKDARLKEIVSVIC